MLPPRILLREPARVVGKQLFVFHEDWVDLLTASRDCAEPVAEVWSRRTRVPTTDQLGDRAEYRKGLRGSVHFVTPKFTIPSGFGERDLVS